MFSETDLNKYMDIKQRLEFWKEMISWESSQTEKQLYRISHMLCVQAIQ